MLAALLLGGTCPAFSGQTATASTGVKKPEDYYPDMAKDWVDIEPVLPPQPKTMTLHRSPSAAVLAGALMAMGGGRLRVNAPGKRFHPPLPEDFFKDTNGKHALERTVKAANRRRTKEERKAADRERTARALRARRGVKPEPTGGPDCCGEPMPWSNEDACYVCPVCGCVSHREDQA